MTTFYVRPVGDYLITDPVTGEPLPKDGAQVEKNNYWLRRLNAGEVEAVAGKDKEANK
ncbi:DUF2635 domain-containing protein [Eikenella corrodens]|uniref:DUF2635 domain-containing protein n=1 Tax=Eikenella corrodens TaxID=539 RepID=UPI0009BAF952|nr:DUF2635 domain-containing protein [Eikenella corrodens]